MKSKHGIESDRSSTNGNNFVVHLRVHVKQCFALMSS